MTDRDAPLVEVLSVTAGYAERTALHGVSLSVRRGELVGLAGPNGSGKSTLLKVVLGLVAADRGSVRLSGDPVSALSYRDRARRIAWMPQDESPQENIPLFDYVLFGRYSHRPPFEAEGASDRAAAEEALRSVGLWDRRDSGVLELSGGERQRVLLARALAQATPLLLLDEPTAHLDIGNQLELLERVQGLCHRTGLACIAALHDLNLAARFTDRLAVLSRGQLVEDGVPRDVLSPELLRDVWGVQAELKRDPATGQPYLIPSLPRRPPRAPSSDRGSVHVVAGGGAAGGLWAPLLDAGYRVTAGVLPLFDSDTEAAERLGIPCVVGLPFTSITPEARAQLRDLLANARAIVVAPIPVGPSNLANLEELLAVAASRPVLLLEPDGWSGRDFTNGVASDLRSRLLAAGATTVADLPTLLAGLEGVVPTAAGGARPAAASPQS